MMNGFLKYILQFNIALGNLPAGIGSSNYDRRGQSTRGVREWNLNFSILPHLGLGMDTSSYHFEPAGHRYVNVGIRYVYYCC